MASIMDKVMGNYRIKAKCSNCKSINIIKISQGITVKEFFNSKKALCDNCGCQIPFSSDIDPREEVFF